MKRDIGFNTAAAAEGADRNTIIAFALMVLFAGGNAVAVRISNGGLPPFWGAVLRMGAAALIFWGVVLVPRIPLPRGRALVGALLYGIVAVGAAYAFLYWSLLRVPASLAGAILALVPLMTLVFAWAHGVEKLRARGVLGGLISTAGMIITVVRGFGAAAHIPSVLALILGTACLAEASIIFKLFPRSHPAATNAVAFTVGTPPLIILSLLAGERWSLPATAGSWVALAYLVIIGSAVVFYLYLHVLERWTASATSYSYILIPIVTAVVASLLVGEVITASFVIGGVVVLAGVWLGAINSSPREAELHCTPAVGKPAC